MHPKIFIVVLAGLVTAQLPAQQQTTSAAQAEIVIARNVENREPVEPGKEFSADVSQLVAWTKVTGAADSKIEHVWRHKDHERVISFDIGGSPWRVWSRKNIPAAWTGEWTFEVRDSGGSVIAATTFTVGNP